MLDFVKDACKHKRLVGPECSISYSKFNIWTPENVPYGFFRPGLKESLHEIKRMFPTAEFFIYSLGTKNYVHSIIEYLEKYTGLKFNRPLFTREDSSITPESTYLKDIHGYENDIFKSLIAKYPLCKDEKVQQKIMNERTIIIDDSPVWGGDYRFVQCKSYTYTPIAEIDHKILNMIYKNSMLKTFINSSKYVDILPDFDDNQTFDSYMLDYHLVLFNMYKNNVTNNNQQLNDDFFPKFVKAIKKRTKYVKPFDKKFLDTLRNVFV